MTSLHGSTETLEIMRLLEYQNNAAKFRVDVIRLLCSLGAGDTGTGEKLQLQIYASILTPSLAEHFTKAIISFHQSDGNYDRDKDGEPIIGVVIKQESNLDIRLLVTERPFHSIIPAFAAVGEGRSPRAEIEVLSRTRLTEWHKEDVVFVREASFGIQYSMDTLE